MPESFRDLAEVFKLLGNPIRLKVIELINQEGELSVKELATKTGVTALTLSQHLSRCFSICSSVSLAAADFWSPCISHRFKTAKVSLQGGYFLHH